MDPTVISILLNLVVLSALIIPVVRGYLNGFVKTVTRFFRFVIAFTLGFILAKPMGVLLKNWWLGEKFRAIVASAFGDSLDSAADSTGLTDALPSGLRTLLDTFGFDTAGAANDAAQAGEAAVQRFIDTIADNLASITSVALAFVLIVVLSLILLKIFSSVLNFIVEKLPLVRGLNHVLGLGVGALIGIVTAWTVAQLVVFLLTTFTNFDYSQASILSFFHDISPLRWVLQLIARTM